MERGKAERCQECCCKWRPSPSILLPCALRAQPIFSIARSEGVFRRIRFDADGGTAIRDRRWLWKALLHNIVYRRGAFIRAAANFRLSLNELRATRGESRDVRSPLKFSKGKSQETELTMWKHKSGPEKKISKNSNNLKSSMIFCEFVTT